jgi:hypothetical protein
MILKHWKRALALGFLSWLVPFAISFCIYPLKKASEPLFETAMSLVLVGVGGGLSRRYFRDEAPGVVPALALGIVWAAINVVFDYPMFAYGPMRMSAARYYSEIGAGYLLYPTFLACAAWMARRPQTV